MKPKQPPKLYAIYGPDGERVTEAYDTKRYAWWSFGWLGRPRKGHVCCEVEIVRVQR